MMTTKKDAGLLPSAREHRSASMLAGITASSAAASSRDGEHIVHEGGKMALRMRVYAETTGYALSQTGRLQSHAAGEFRRTCADIDSVVTSATGTGSEGHVKVFGDLQKDQVADQMMDVYDKGVGMIKSELQRSLPNKAPSDEPKGFIARLLG